MRAARIVITATASAATTHIALTVGQAGSKSPTNTNSFNYHNNPLR